MAGGIICGVDDSPEAVAAARVASDLTERLGTQMILVDVSAPLAFVPLPGRVPRMAPRAEKGLHDVRNQQAQALVEAVAREAGVTEAERTIVVERERAMRELTDQERTEIERDAVLPQLDARELVDEEYLERAIKEMYTEVADNPDGEFHFLTGRSLAEGLGYDPALLDRIPAEAIDSFAGVGHYLDLARLGEGECVVDLGSGSGTDLFCAAVLVGRSGRAIGIDMTAAQLEKSGRLRDAHGFSQVELVEARIEQVPLEDGIADCVVSNGVINLAPDKGRVFAEAAESHEPCFCLLG